MGYSYVETVSVEKVLHKGTVNSMVSNKTQHATTKEFINTLPWIKSVTLINLLFHFYYSNIRVLCILELL